MVRRFASIRNMFLFASIAGAITGGATAWAEPAAPSPEPTVAITAIAAQDSIWSGVVIATNEKTPKEAPPELKEFAARLKRVFGYNQFALFGSASNPIGDRTEHWLVPSQNFWLGVNARRAVSKEARGGYLLSIQLFQDKRPLVDSEAKLAPGSPLFIRGPMHGDGQLIIVLQVKQGAGVADRR